MKTVTDINSDQELEFPVTKVHYEFTSVENEAIVKAKQLLQFQPLFDHISINVGTIIAFETNDQDFTVDQVLLKIHSSGNCYMEIYEKYTNNRYWFEV